MGLDLGIASVGWSVVELGYDEKSQDYYPKRLIDCGVRLFDKAEVPKTGDSLNLKRREARSARRIIRRRKARIVEVRRRMEEFGFLPHDADLSMNSLDKDIWEIRGKDVFERVLTDRELTRLIVHIAKKRGYKSNRKKLDDDMITDKEGKKVLSAIERNKELLKERNLRTYGELVYSLYGGTDRRDTLKHNTTDQYIFSFDREGTLEELRFVLNCQKELGNTKITDDFIKEIVGIVSFQRPFASGEVVKKMVGKCEFEPDELRAPKISISFLEFEFWQNALNNLKLIDTEEGKPAKPKMISLEQKEKLFAEVFSSSKDKITYSFVRKVLDIPNNEIFYNFRYDMLYRAGNKSIEDERIFLNLTEYQKFRRGISKIDELLWEKIRNDRSLYNSLAEALTWYKTDEDMEKYLREKGLGEYVELAKSLPTFSKFGHLSIKALEKILPYLKENDYTEACRKAGYGGKLEAQKLETLPLINYDEIRNPIVFRGVTQARKVVNAIVRKYGPPTFVNVELARELSKNFKARKEMERWMELRRKVNEEACEEIVKTFGISNPSGSDILKYKLWKEQGGRCLYSGEPIQAERLFEDSYCQIDHAIPYSQSMNDSYNNKVLVLTKENQEKRDETPYQYLNRIDPSGNRWKKYKEMVESNPRYKSGDDEKGDKKSKNKNDKGNKKFKKKDYLLIENTENFTINDFIERNLNDTKYICKFFKNYVEDNLKMKELKSGKRQVYTFQGGFTSNLRRMYGVEKDRELNDRHHALDAIMLAVGNQSMLMRIIDYNKKKERHKADWEVFKEKENLKFPEPWVNFRRDILNRVLGTTFEEISDISNFEELYGDIKSEIKPLFVSRMPRRKVEGAAHEETLYSPKHLDEGFVLVKKRLSDLKRKNVENIYGDEVVKNLIKERFENNPENPFGEPLYKPSPKNNNPNQIKSVKLKVKTGGGGILLNHGRAYAENDLMVRIDIFSKGGKYFIIPIYVSDTVNKELPNRAIVADSESEEEWTLIDDTFKFEFSLYKYDLVSWDDTDGKRELYYYIKTNRNSGSSTFYNHDRSGKEVYRGIKTARNFTKYEVDVLGNVHKVRAEKRHGFQKHSNHKTL